MAKQLTLIRLCYHRIQSIQSGMPSYLHPTKQVLFSYQSWFHLFIQLITNLSDDNFTQLLIPNWKVRLTGFITSSIVLSLLATLVFSIVNAVILLIF